MGVMRVASHATAAFLPTAVRSRRAVSRVPRADMTSPASAQQVRTMTAWPAPAPLKNTAERIAVPAAPIGMS